MREFNQLDSNISTIRSMLPAMVGAKLTCYETAEALQDDGAWSAWPDLPIRLNTDTGKLIAIAWSDIDHLWIASDTSLPFSIEGTTVRWVKNAIEKINGAVGNAIVSVEIGRGQMSVDGCDVEIWTRLLIELSNGWLEIFKGERHQLGVRALPPGVECRPIVGNGRPPLLNSL